MDLTKKSKRMRNPTIRLTLSYLFDWTLCVILIAVFFLLDKVEPFHRRFSVLDTSIMYPSKEKDTIPDWALGVLGVVVPAVIIGCVSLGIRRSPYDCHNGVLGLLVSVLLTVIFTNVMKVTIGKHRPDFLSRCQPMLNGKLLTYDEPLSLWSVDDVCTQPDHDILQEGMRAFPSGHASISFAGLVYLSLWMGGKMHVFDRRGYSVKGLVVVTPVLGAILVAVSRVQDYRHSGIDVTWGSIIGIVFAMFAYHQYYPSLLNANPQVPHPPRDFSYLVKDTHGQHREAGHLEQVTGIHPNDDFVDESRPQQLRSMEVEDVDSKPADATLQV